MNRLLYWSTGEEATRRFGLTLGRAIVRPAWVGLYGPLGAGKTRLVQGLALGLGYKGHVRSPSFVLEQRYSGRLSIRHLDLYRLEEAAPDLEAVWEEDETAVVVVEWAERVSDAPGGALRVRLDPVGETGRWITLEWPVNGGPLDTLRLEGLRGA